MSFKTAPYSTCSAVQCITVQHNTKIYNTMQCNANVMLNTAMQFDINMMSCIVL